MIYLPVSSTGRSLEKEGYLNFNNVYSELSESVAVLACHPSKLVLRMTESLGVAVKNVKALIEKIFNTGHK